MLMLMIINNTFLYIIDTPVTTKKHTMKNYPVTKIDFLPNLGTMQKQNTFVKPANPIIWVAKLAWTS